MLDDNMEYLRQISQNICRLYLTYQYILQEFP